MPMNEEVRKAVENLDGTALAMHRDWQTIRAELTRLTEIADSVDPIVIRLHDVTAKLEAANALLREVKEDGNAYLMSRIDAHLHNSAREAGE